MIQPWPLLASQDLGDFRVFRLRRDEKRSPRTGLAHQFYVLDCDDWVNVVALTPDHQIILVEQFRHGTNTVELEVPGGIQDAQDASPLATAVRELREETGYAGDKVTALARIAPNPAIMSNAGHIVLIENCRWVRDPTPDSGEDLRTRLVALEEVNGLVRTGAIRHSIVLAALYYLDLWRRAET